MDDATAEAPVDPGSTTDNDATAQAARADRTSRLLILAFVLCLCFIGWLGVSGIDVAASDAWLFGPAPGGCGGG